MASTRFTFLLANAEILASLMPFENSPARSLWLRFLLTLCYSNANDASQPIMTGMAFNEGQA